MSRHEPTLNLGETACPVCGDYAIPYAVEWKDNQRKLVHCDSCETVFAISFRVIRFGAKVQLEEGDDS